MLYIEKLSTSVDFDNIDKVLRFLPSYVMFPDDPSQHLTLRDATVQNYFGTKHSVTTFRLVARFARVRIEDW